MAWWKTALRIAGAILALALLVGSVWVLSSRGMMRHVLLRLQRLGAWGYVVLAGMFLPISTPFGYGYTPVGFTCGALYGFIRGTLVIMVGADGGAVLAFMGIRYLFKDWFREWLQSKRRLRLLMRAVDLNATKFAFLSRFTPIPWGIQNTIYAVSDIELWKFAVLTSLGGFPDQAIIAFMGSQVQVVLIAEGDVGMGTGKWLMVALELFACLALAVLMVIFAKRAIDQTNAEEDFRLDLESAKRAQTEAQQIMGVLPAPSDEPLPSHHQAPPAEAAGVSAPQAAVPVVGTRRADDEGESEKHSLLEPMERVPTRAESADSAVSGAKLDALRQAKTEGEEAAGGVGLKAAESGVRPTSPADAESPSARLLADEVPSV